MNSKRILLMSLFTLLTPVSPLAFADTGPGGTGGGNGVAAEIQRATDEFIRMVKANPAQFPGVDPQVLNQVNAEILVTGKPIGFCDKSGELDAYSDLGKGQSTFNLGNWMKKGWLEKVQLAGHERLILAHYEQSNRYPFSNKVYEISRSKEEKETGPAKAVCDFGSSACEDSKKIETVISNVVSQFSGGEMSAASAHAHLGMTETAIDTQIHLLVGLKQLEIQRRWINFGDTQAEASKYEQQVRLAYENHFRPLLLEAKRVIDEQLPEPKCVQASPSEARLESHSGLVDLNRTIASGMSSKDRSESRSVSENSQKALEDLMAPSEANSSSSLAKGAR